MKRSTKLITIGATGLAVVAGGTGLAIAAGATDGIGDSETPISGPALDTASAAALDHVGEGRVSATEVGDEESYYEVEVTRDDGSETDVQLDRGFDVVGAESDDDSETDDD